MNPYKIIEGKFPTYREMNEWPEERWLTLLDYLDFFIEIVSGKEMFKVSEAKMKEMELLLKEKNHRFHEFIYRIGLWKKEKTPRQFYYKLNSLSLHCLSYLKKKPALVSQNIKERLEKRPTRFGWALKQYKVNDSNAGELVQRDTKALDGFEEKNIAMPSIQADVMTAQTKIVSIYKELANSIDIRELKRMDIKDKLNQLTKLSFILTAATRKVTNNHFTQINLNGDVKEQEKLMLEYVKKKNNQ